jgi:hypothetical protein
MNPTYIFYVYAKKVPYILKASAKKQLPSAFRWSKRVHRERGLVSGQRQGEENAAAAHHLLQPPDTAARALVPAEPVPGAPGARRARLQPGPHADAGREG